MRSQRVPRHFIKSRKKSGAATQPDVLLWRKVKETGVTAESTEFHERWHNCLQYHVGIPSARYGKLQFHIAQITRAAEKRKRILVETY